MKKRIILVTAVIAAALGLALSVRQVFLKSHNTSYEITEQEITDRILINEITNEAYEGCFSESLQSNEAEKYIKQYSKPTSRKNVIEELKRAKFMRSVLEKEKCSVDYSEAKKAAEEEYERMKTDDTSAEYYKSLKAVLDKSNITEEQYLKLTYDYAYDLYSETDFNAWFLKNKYKYDDTDRDPELKYADEYPGKDEQIDAYYKKEMKKINIIIKG